MMSMMRPVVVVTNHQSRTRQVRRCSVTSRFSGAISVLAAVVAVWSLTSVAASGQESTIPTKTWDPPRTPDGQPDIQGFWNNGTGGSTTSKG
jgi:hypothetical protein